MCLNRENNEYISHTKNHIEYSSVYLLLLNSLDTIYDHDINLLLLTYASMYAIY